MFYRSRQRQRAMAEAEARGESFWTDEFSPRARRRISIVIDNVLGTAAYATKVRARSLVLADEGLDSLFFPGTDAGADFDYGLTVGEDSLIPSLIEAVLMASDTVDLDPIGDVFVSGRPRVEREIAAVLEQERISFEFVDGQMIEFASRELHTEVVAPAITLLGGDPQLADVEAAYRKALDEIASGSPDDAITDVTRAFEEMLKVLGAQGSSLSARVTDARKRKLLTGYDPQLVEAVKVLAGWATADRGAMGDAHPGDGANSDDAWLAVHVVGALILRLSKGPREAE